VAPLRPAPLKPATLPMPSWVPPALVSSVWFSLPLLSKHLEVEWVARITFYFSSLLFPSSFFHFNPRHATMNSFISLLFVLSFFPHV